MRILANENVYEPIVQYLKAKGHEVISCRSPELSGATDDEVYRKAVAEGLAIITMDKDFMRMRRFPPHNCGGIILIKIYRRTVEETTRIFQEHFDKISEYRIRGNLVIITPEGARIRISKREELKF